MADAMKLVPVEPTEAMLNAMTDALENDCGVELVYSAILAVSPPAREEAPAEGAGGSLREDIAAAIAGFRLSDYHAGTTGPATRSAWERALDKADKVLALRNRTSEPAREAGIIAHVSYGRSELPGLIYTALTAREEAPAEGAGEYLRPEVQAFAQLMEDKLRANDWKGGWKSDFSGDLLRRAHEELGELDDEMASGDPAMFDNSAVANEAADVANMLMMVVDVCGALPALRNRTSEPAREADWQSVAGWMGFAASVIKSGEPWTDQCHREFDEAKSAYGRLSHAPATADKLKVAVRAFMPTNIDLSNPNIRDDQVLPYDTTAGELRAILAALNEGGE